ncbi:hypothetical protein [Mycobacterium sp. TY814]|uniref:hypothetical protein n=1 Tax=unclassified Mycobacterium TaxID=2642494 RepID=UPI003531E2C7
MSAPVMKVRAGTSHPIAEDPAAQVELARAEAELRSARALVLDEARPTRLFQSGCPEALRR